MKKNCVLIVLLFSLLGSCTKDNKPTLCGEDKTFQIFKSTNMRETGSVEVGLWLDSRDPRFHTYMEGNNRVFQWSDVVENACPDEHAVVYCKVSVRDIPCPITTRGEIWTSAVLQPATITMTQSGNEITGQNEAGLKQVYGDDPAKFVPLLEILFPTKGSFSADSLFFFDEVSYISLKADYSAYSF